MRAAIAFSLVSSAFAVTVLTPQANYVQSLDCEVYSKYPVTANSRMHLNLCFQDNKAIAVGFTRSDVELGDAAKASWGTTWNVPCRPPTSAQDAFVYIPTEHGITPGTANGQQVCTVLTYPPLNQPCFPQEAAIYISISKKWVNASIPSQNFAGAGIPVIVNGLTVDDCSLPQNQVTGFGNANAQLTKSSLPSATITSSAKPTGACGYPAPSNPPAPQAPACATPIPPSTPAPPDALYGGGGGGGGGGRVGSAQCPAVPPAASAPGAPPAKGYVVCSGPGPAGTTDDAWGSDIVAEATKASSVAKTTITTVTNTATLNVVSTAPVRTSVPSDAFKLVVAAKLWLIAMLFL